MTVQVWKDPDSDALRIQYDGEDGPIYELADQVDPQAGADEVDHVPRGWIDLVPEPEPAVPVARLREFAAYLEELARSERFYTPNGFRGEKVAGAQALADSACRLLHLIHTGKYE